MDIYCANWQKWYLILTLNFVALPILYNFEAKFCKTTAGNINCHELMLRNLKFTVFTFTTETPKHGGTKLSTFKKCFGQLGFVFNAHY